MQIKKDEVRLKILEIAMNEFLSKGYENASMRVIAKKAHTTQGNIYHYFCNKEVFLETILLPTIKNIEQRMIGHIENQRKTSMTKEQAFDYAEHLEENFENSELTCFLDKKVIILFKIVEKTTFTPI